MHAAYIGHFKDAESDIRILRRNLLRLGAVFRLQDNHAAGRLSGLIHKPSGKTDRIAQPFSESDMFAAMRVSGFAVANLFIFNEILIHRITTFYCR